MPTRFLIHCLFYQQENRDLGRRGDFPNHPPGLWQGSGLITLPPRAPSRTSAAICLQLNSGRCCARLGRGWCHLTNTESSNRWAFLLPHGGRFKEQAMLNSCTHRAETACGVGPDARLHITDSQTLGRPPSPDGPLPVGRAASTSQRRRD